MMRDVFRSVLALIYAVGLSAFAYANPIRDSQITPSTTLPAWNGFTVDNLADGQSADSGNKHGFVTTRKTGTIQLALNRPYDIEGFKLWNDVTVRAEGVKDFRLIFFKNDGTEETSPNFTARSEQVDVQTFKFDKIKNVVRVDLIILSSLREQNTHAERIEIRELEFIEASPNSAPVPTDDTFVVDERQSVRISPLSNDVDFEGDSLILSEVFDVPSAIKVFPAASNRLLITAGDTAGVVEFKYKVVDSQGAASSGTIRGEVRNVNRHPALTNPSMTIIMKGRKETTLDLVGFATDPDGDPLRISKLYNISQTLKAETVPGTNDTTVRFTSLKGNTNLAFNYDISDGKGGVVTGTIRVMVNEPAIWPWIAGGVALLLLALGLWFIKFVFGPGGKTPPKRPEKRGFVFFGSPLLAGNVAAPLSTTGQLTASSLQTLTGQYAILRPAYLSTGRIGFAQKGKPTNKDIAFGTGFLITPNHVMTNRHVYEVYKDHLTGKSGGGIEFHAEKDKDVTDFVAFDGEAPYLPPGIDIAIFKLSRSVTDRKPIPTDPVDIETLDDRDIVVVGYPCPRKVTEYVAAAVEEDPIFAVKRISQGKIFRHSTDVTNPYGIEAPVSEQVCPKGVMPAVCHNASTLGGSSGSPLLDEHTGELVGVHFGFDVSFEWEEAANFAMAIKTVMEGLEDFDAK